MTKLGIVRVKNVRENLFVLNVGRDLTRLRFGTTSAMGVVPVFVRYFEN